LTTISAPVEAYDEAFDAAGAPRPHYAPVLQAVVDAGPAHLRDAARTATAIEGLALDPIPRVFAAQEWDALAEGLAQRARALDALAADAHGERRAVAAGAIAAGDLDAHAEPDLWAAPSPQAWVAIAAFDLARLPDGRLAVLRDDVTAPAPEQVAALREASDLRRRVTTPPRDAHGPALGLLRGLLDADPERSAILADDASAGHLLGVPVLGLADVTARRGRLTARADGRTLETVWRRTSEHRLRDAGGGLTALGDVLLEPLLHGSVRVVNHPGAECAAAADVARAVEALLGEEPLLETAGDLIAPSVVATVGENGALERRPAGLRVFAIRSGGGYEVVPGGVSRFTTAGGAPGLKDVWVVDDGARFGR
jgi:carboxylate-amine ligase